jgi:hypothetical protein
MESDQLKEQLELGIIFSAFKEGEINFAPTYKYDNESTVYDTRCISIYFSEKARAPAYTDRILYKGDMRLIEYGRGEQLMSDHRPGLLFN